MAGRKGTSKRNVGEQRRRGGEGDWQKYSVDENAIVKPITLYAGFEINQPTN